MRPQIKEKVDGLYLMSTKALAREYFKITGHPPPTPHRHRLIRKIAWEYQCIGLNPVSAEALARAQEIAKSERLRSVPPKDFEHKLPKKKSDITLYTGDILTRNYKGKRYEVLVTERGFELDGMFFKSISAMAKKITGTHWNGKRFFGLV
ncbi:MAG: DUF2924 domain-containing protein [Candidatus Marinimicrobia bacterium]|nr:DUF2924 domain-containing protein [Candidatus Neomarinimicrobiota bacterium]